MPKESRVQRWRKAKQERGLKGVMIWLTEDEELRLKDLAVQWHGSPSAVVQRALAQISTTTAPQHSSPPDTLRIRELILAELEALGLTVPSETGRVTEGVTEGPPDTQSPDTPPIRTAPGRHKLTPRQVRALRDKHHRGVPVPALMEEYGISRASVFRYLQSDQR